MCAISCTATVRKDAVRWRERNGKRPWLAGLVIERMCALIDMNCGVGEDSWESFALQRINPVNPKGNQS